MLLVYLDVSPAGDVLPIVKVGSHYDEASLATVIGENHSITIMISAVRVKEEPEKRRNTKTLKRKSVLSGVVGQKGN